MQHRLCLVLVENEIDAMRMVASAMTYQAYDGYEYDVE